MGLQLKPLSGARSSSLCRAHWARGALLHGERQPRRRSSTKADGHPGSAVQVPCTTILLTATSLEAGAAGTPIPAGEEDGAQRPSRGKHVIPPPRFHKTQKLQSENPPLGPHFWSAHVGARHSGRCVAQGAHPLAQHLSPTLCTGAALGTFGLCGNGSSARTLAASGDARPCVRGPLTRGPPPSPSSAGTCPHRWRLLTNRMKVPPPGRVQLCTHTADSSGEVLSHLWDPRVC